MDDTTIVDPTEPQGTEVLDFLTDGVVGLVPPADIALESSWCWTLTTEDGRLALYVVGMDSLSPRRAGRYGNDHDAFHTSSIAYDGVDRLVMPYNGHINEWFQLDLTTGEVRQDVSYGTGNPQAASTWGGEFLVVEGVPKTGMLYPDFDAMLAAEPSGQTPALDGLISRHTVDADLMFSAWQATDTVEVIDLVTGKRVDTIGLEGFYGPVEGIGVRGGFVHLLGSDGLLWRFDMEGALVNQVSLDALGGIRRVGGLWCDAP